MTTIALMGVVTVVAAGIALPDAAPPAKAPLDLHTYRYGELVTISVVRNPGILGGAGYIFTVASGSGAAPNRTITRGHVNLSPGSPLHVAQVTIRLARSGFWQARLDVSPDRGAPYTLIEQDSPLLR